jgi:RNA polymerase subunit RPABC4/transcription elongation factor Spt4
MSKKKKCKECKATLTEEKQELCSICYTKKLWGEI